MMLAVEDDKIAKAQYILRWIRRFKLRTFTKRDAHQHGKRQFRKANDLDPVLKELEERNYIRRKPETLTKTGRPPSPTYDVNPKVFDSEYGDDRRHNSRNAELSSQTPDCEDIENASAEDTVTRRQRVTI